MTIIKLTDREITIETKGRQVRLVWDEHMQEWAPCITNQSSLLINSLPKTMTNTPSALL